MEGFPGSGNSRTSPDQGMVMDVGWVFAEFIAGKAEAVFPDG